MLVLDLGVGPALHGTAAVVADEEGLFIWRLFDLCFFLSPAIMP